MTLNKLFLLFGVVLLLGACSSENNPEIDTEQQNPNNPPVEPEEPQEPALVTYLTYTPDFYTEDKDHWIIIHNQDGELLDYKSFESGDELVFEAKESELSSTDKLSVSIMTYNLETANNTHTINTYTGIDKGTVWETTNTSGKISPGSDYHTILNSTHKTSKSLSKKAPVPYNLTVNNIPNIDKYTLTSIEDHIVKENHLLQHSTVLNLDQIELSSDIEYLLSIGDGDGGLKYFIINPPENQDDIVLDYADFLDYDSIIEVDLPDNHHFLNANVWARSSDDFLSEPPLLLSRDASAGPAAETAQFGYLNSYPHFDTFFTIDMVDGYGYGYNEVGQIPDAIAVMPKPNFEILNASLSDFDFSTDITYLRRTSLWALWEAIPTDGNLDQTRWYVHSSSNETGKIGALPDEIIQKYPNLNLDDLYHINTSLILKGQSYQDLINLVFKRISILYPVYEWVDFGNPID
ncbi:MAG: hypothetical protein AB3N18_07740 [Allomuricauda sp.]